MKTGGVFVVALTVAIATVWVLGGASSASAAPGNRGQQDSSPVVETGSGKVRGRVENLCGRSKAFRFPSPRWDSCVGALHKPPSLGRACVTPAPLGQTACRFPFRVMPRL